MKPTLRALPVILAIAVLGASCSKKTPKHAQYIPKDASFVLVADPKSLASKVKDAHLDMDSLLRLAGGDSLVTKMNALKDGGIDFSERVMMFLSQKGGIMGGGSEATVGVVFGLKDAAAYEAALKKHSPGLVVSKQGDFSYARLEHDGIAGWKSDGAVVLFSHASPSAFSFDMKNGHRSMHYADTTGVDDTAKIPGASAADSTHPVDLPAAAPKDLLPMLTSLMAQKESESVVSVKPFSDILSRNADILFYSNSDATAASVPMVGMTKFGDLLSGNYSTGSLSFETGKIVGEHTTVLSDQLYSIISKYKFSDADFGLIQRYPSSSIVGFMSLFVDPKVITEIVRYGGFEASANQYLAQMGITLDDVTKAFKGDIAMIGSDLNVVEKPQEFNPAATTKSPSFKFVFDMPVGDKAAFHKVMDACVSRNFLTKRGNAYYPPAMGNMMGISSVADDNGLTVASDSALLTAYRAGTGKAVLPDGIESKAKGHSATVFVDFTKFASFAPDFAATFKDAISTTTSSSGNSYKGEMELRMQNDKENSLATLIRFAALMHKKM